MKTLLPLVLIAAALSTAHAQDSRGRQRQPPPDRGGSQGGGQQGGSEPSRGGQRRDDPQPDRGRDWTPPPAGGDGTSGGTARRRIPRPAPIGDSHAQPTAPSRDESGSPLGHAVRRDSLPPRHVGGSIGGYDPRRWDERERGRYYWHHHGGYRYCHYVDPYGTDWYYWYFDDGYYSMRYHDGFWWRYDGRYGRWVYLHEGWWYYHDGSRVYAYEESRGSYDGVDEGWDAPVQPRKLELKLDLGSFGLGEGGSGSVIKENGSYLDFDGRVGGVAVGAEVNLGINNHLEAGVGVGYQSGSTGSQYRDYVRDDGSEIRQDIRVRNLPVNVNAKVYPFGRDQRIQPYVGAGVQVNSWRYEESGQFIDFNTPNNDIYKETYKASGVSVGPVAIAGLKVPLNDKVSIGAEYRRQWGKGRLPEDGGFAGDHLDLGANTFQAGVTIKLK